MASAARSTSISSLKAKSMWNTLRRKAKSGKIRVFVFYAAMIGISVAVLILILANGKDLVAPLPQSDLSQGMTSQQGINTLLQVLLALAVVIVTARTVGALFSLIHQPAVIGEIIGGIILGPSVLGRILPQLASVLLPSVIAPFLSVLAQIGVILYMFLVGLELDLRVIYGRGHATVAISHAGILLPFLLGAGFSLILYPVMSTSDVPFAVFALFIGVCLSITAFPVLARILTDRNMHKTRIGSIALTCAAVDDAAAWCLLAVVVGVAQSRIDNAIQTIALTFVFVLAVLMVVRPLVERLMPFLEAKSELTRRGLAIIFVAMLSSAICTEFIGIHAIFGAFLLGAIIPSSSRIASELIHRLQDFISVIFLPVFFAFSGMRTQIGLVSGARNWLICAAIILIACIGKFVGVLIASRIAGLSFRDSSALGVLMNTRGLVELIVLNIGLDLKVITPTLFAMLVLMALVTTFITSPVLHLILRNESLGQSLNGG